MYMFSLYMTAFRQTLSILSILCCFHFIVVFSIVIFFSVFCINVTVQNSVWQLFVNVIFSFFSHLLLLLTTPLQLIVNFVNYRHSVSLLVTVGSGLL